MAATGRVAPASRKTWVFFLWMEVVLVTVGVGDHTRNTDGKLYVKLIQRSLLFLSQWR